MALSAMETAVVEADPFNRTVRLFRYLRDNPGPQKRDTIMHWCEFPSPKREPVCAYVEFANATMRLHRVLKQHGKSLARDAAAETYWIVGGAA